MTRVAGANPRIWVDIFLDNASELRTALAEHRRRVEQLETALELGDAGFLARWIGEAATKREELLRDAFEETAELFRVQVHVADRPGILAAIMQALGAERINIEDLELHHVSRERGGTLALLISGEEAANRAAAVLGTQGYDVDVAPELVV
jgi:prephenate dehydrogenase